jgi:diguanylate cyclase (GGDEF)-like protein
MAAARRSALITLSALAATALVTGWVLGLRDHDVMVIVDDSAQLTAGLTATLCCWWTARRRVGPDRTWRLLMATGMGGWTIGQLIWSWYQVVADVPLPSPSLADVGYLTLPVFALPALLSLAAGRAQGQLDTTPAQSRRERRRTRLVVALDGPIVVGSMFVLTWSTALGAVVRGGAPTPAAFAVAIAYPLTDLMLVVIVVLLGATQRVPRPRRPQLVLLGLGLVALAVSDSIFAYLISSGADEMPPLTNLGFIAGPALIAVAACASSAGGATAGGRRIDRAVEWGHVLLPYLPLTATGVLIVVQAATHHGPHELEIYAGFLLVGLVVGRQMITLIENTALLERVSEGQRRLKYQAFHDPLTGLANRALFRDRLAHAVELNRRDRRPVALLFVDLDDFKAINDSQGHAVGDGLLRAVGSRLRDCVRTADTVARLGGDEFAVLLEGAADLPEQVGRRILAELHRPFDVDGRTISVGASLGVVAPDAAEPALTSDALLRRADAAMYAGKRRGKGMLVLYRPDLTATMDHPDLPTLLAEALGDERGRDGFDVHYQPIVRMADRTPVAVEALARWTHPTVGTVPPDVFIAIAERAGLIAALDNLVLERSCQDMAALRDRHGMDLDVHVNISATRLGDAELENAVFTALDRSGLPARQLVLEVTETARIPDLNIAGDAARRLRAHGIRLALDDFGTGYNTLLQLHLLPVDIVKLDRGLLATDGDRRRVEALCRSVVAISAALDVTLIAEGLETAEQAAALAALGCDLGQGHLYGRAAPLQDGAFAAAVDHQASIEDQAPTDDGAAPRNGTAVANELANEVATPRRWSPASPSPSD